jgi:hypothetical protein
MKPFESAPELLTVARRVMWFKEPAESLAEPIHFLAHVMTYGDEQDINAISKAGVGLDHFREVLDNAPPGIFDKKSWAYWHLKCKRLEPPALPVRKLDVP